jgi:hypothetical protein
MVRIIANSPYPFDWLTLFDQIVHEKGRAAGVRLAYCVVRLLQNQQAPVEQLCQRLHLPCDSVAAGVRAIRDEHVRLFKTDSAADSPNRVAAMFSLMMSLTPVLQFEEGDEEFSEAEEDEEEQETDDDEEEEVDDEEEEQEQEGDDDENLD